MSSDPWTPVSSAVAAQGPTNLTAIGLGLVEAICDAEKSTNDPQLILIDADALRRVLSER